MENKKQEIFSQEGADLCVCCIITLCFIEIFSQKPGALKKAQKIIDIKL